ncbi:MULTISPECIES: phosphate signaling complex protein PhoU [Allobranchiibius]|uniref:Phosphate-specific transport system accessory protein PhoU n=1 Tax=Allobranchiibius huperziae TaxID=1874116 RepID=A0A853DEK9_9MICO|nr:MULTISPECIES: phosphate signaling complex protein PhoU [Allobranchiibius]NYJ75902.1 phosphate transport system protein [Allobranchiibius huperziae]UIJ35980.1 phosphate signaling complex protein PhoU [Allobranchiibius sp. GilTou73]
MRDAFHEDLDKISDDLVEMTRLVGIAMTRATDALLQADLSLAESVIAADDDIDQLRRQVDDHAIDLLARQQPVATDLRMVVTAMHMASDIERMGDLARHIAKVARMRYPEHGVPDELREVITDMEKTAAHLAAKTGEAIAHKDALAAVEIEKDDDALDQLHRKVFATLVDHSWAHGTEAAVDATLISRYYERFGDHAVAVAARIVYLVTGRYADQQS